LLAEYDLRGNDVGSDTGLNDIRYQPHAPPYYMELCREWDRAHPGVRPPLLPGFTEGDLDTALAMARGARYYRWVDPPFIAPPRDDDPPCRPGGGCDPIESGGERNYRRCDSRGRCRAAATPPRTGAHYFYSVTATDVGMERRGGRPILGENRLTGAPHTNYTYVVPPSAALRPEEYHLAKQQIYVVPNPATPASLTAWALNPNNDDPTGIKIEFHHLPAARGKVSIFTLAGDLVKEIGFDGRGGNGTVRWDLVTRNGQEVTSGVYLYVVETDDSAFERFISKFVVVR
jgi:hypothetical protein